MKVYCTNTCHDISQYLAMERLHPGKKTIQIFSGIDRCYNKAIKDEGITEDYKVLIIFLRLVVRSPDSEKKGKQFILDLDEEIHFWTFVEQDFMFMINFCWDLDCPKQKVIRGVFSSCKTKSICTFFGYMFFEKIIMTLFKCICTVFRTDCYDIV